MKRIKPSIGSFVSFSIFMIILLQCDPSFAQRCFVTCKQTAIVRNRSYTECFEIIENRAWEQQEDFDLADLIIRHKRDKPTDNYEEVRAFEGIMEPPEPRQSNNGTMAEFLEMMEDIIEFMMEEVAPPMTAASMIGVLNMVMPQLISAAPSLGSAPFNFAGPQPGTLGGGFLPTAITNQAVIAGTSIFGGLGLVGVGPLVALFDKPKTNDNFAAIAGIFEEGNVPQRLRRIGKRGIRSKIITKIKILLWIIQTIEKGQSKIFRILLHKLFKKFQKEKSEQLYGVFAEITLVENKQCNLIPDTPDTCSKFNQFLNLPSRPLNYNRRSHDGNLTNNYRRQGETGFLFNNPTCNRRCF